MFAPSSGESQPCSLLVRDAASEHLMKALAAQPQHYRQVGVLATPRCTPIGPSGRAWEKPWQPHLVRACGVYGHVFLLMFSDKCARQVILSACSIAVPQA